MIVSRASCGRAVWFLALKLKGIERGGFGRVVDADVVVERYKEFVAYASWVVSCTKESVVVLSRAL